MVGIQQNLESPLFQISERVGYMRSQAALQVIRREVKMPGGRNIFSIDVFQFQIEDGAGIRQNISPAPVLQNHGKPGLCSRFPHDLLYVRSAGGKALECNIAHGILADTGNETYPAAQGGEIVGDRKSV